MGTDLFQPRQIGGFIDTGKCDSKKAHEAVRSSLFTVHRSPFTVAGQQLMTIRHKSYFRRLTHVEMPHTPTTAEPQTANRKL
jgi:hypothetical protein